ncbi:hypothetical protein VTP01DRAFT_2940 [Rhizomucor pusillus]|uniref:uncharacterized protein n=1 Tax=Rhizomucor pusillus TaxID=4840 RepID=UPI003744187E
MATENCTVGGAACYTTALASLQLQTATASNALHEKRKNLEMQCNEITSYSTAYCEEISRCLTEVATIEPAMKDIAERVDESAKAYLQQFLAYVSDQGFDSKQKLASESPSEKTIVDYEQTVVAQKRGMSVESLIQLQVDNARHQIHALQELLKTDLLE